MSSLLGTVIPAVLAALVAYQGGLTRTTRLRSLIKANVDLLGTLPAEHPSRATLEAHIGELVDMLIRRQRRRFEPITRAGWLFGANAAFAFVALLAVLAAVLEMTAVWHPDSEPRSQGGLWSILGFYAVLAVCFAFFALRAWRRQQREHPAQAH